jgi:hypothetical protein
MIPQEVVDKLREKYHTVHPMIFLRSVERARSPGELFDILESLPKELPVVWDHQLRRWVISDDLTLSKEMQFPEVQ